jgi:2-oxoglutarate dehydrogenase E1 component
MYVQIRSHPRVREIWAKRLEEEGVVSRDEAEAMVKAIHEELMNARNTPAPHDPAQNYPDATEDQGKTGPQSTAVPAERLDALNESLVQVPDNFTVDVKLNRNLLQARRTAFNMENGINWAHAEALAFASLLEEGTPIRLTGQDSENGTFTQRHMVLHDTSNGREYCPLKNLPQATASFALYNSPLSEIATLGFEYGYSVHATDTLVLWEAQFGDFSNGAQVILDQFIVSGNAKWGQSPSVVMLLPHGYEGQGPEHSSGRIERYLQLCAGDNMHVANCTSSAQYFHLLRRHAQQLKAMPRPLVIFTPKSLLRHVRAASSLADLTEGTFHPVLDDSRDATRKAGVTRLILCSGKVYIDLVYAPKPPTFDFREDYQNADTVAVARVEELNPFPAAELTALLASYPNLTEVVWVQEEPKNMGAWTFMQPRLAELLPDGMRLRYVGRPEAASPAEGSLTLHNIEQKRLVAEAFTFFLKEANGAAATNGNGNKQSKHGAGHKTTARNTAQRTEAEPHAR